MKTKLIKFLIIFVLIGLASCSENKDKQEVKDTNNISLTSEPIQTNNNPQTTDNKELSDNPEITKDLKIKLNKEIAFFKSNDIYFKKTLNCEYAVTLYKGYSKEQNQILDDFKNNCISLREEAKKELELKSQSFNIKDCSININKRFEKYDGQDKKELLSSSIKNCELSYAIKGGCDKLQDIKDKNTCQELKDIERKKQEIKLYSSFNPADYIK